jgi:signal peptidase I
VRTLVSVLAALILLFTFAVRLIVVSGPSMENTLHGGDTMLVWSLGYQPKQGDIVIANKTTRECSDLLGGEAIVKRVIATGGQSVDIDYDNNLVYVDGQPLQEDYILEEMWWPTWNYDMMQTHWDVPEGSVFLMGDNRNGSTDSRHTAVGTVDNDYLLGKAIFTFFPFDRIGPV